MRKHLVAASLLMVMVAGVALAAGDWSGAKGAADDFKSYHQNYLNLTRDQVTEIVTAICEAEEEDRVDASERIKRTVQSKVDAEWNDLKSRRERTLRQLDDVIADDTLKDNHSDAKSLREDVETRWKSFEKMKARLQGANHPVVRFMLEQGKSAHTDRQGRCSLAEFTLEKSGRADCMMASGETCYVVELKPDNSRAHSKGRAQVGRYEVELNEAMELWAEELKKEKAEDRKLPKVLENLWSKNLDFRKCKVFRARVDCYRLCPTADSDGNTSEPAANWREGC